MDGYISIGAPAGNVASQAVIGLNVADFFQNDCVNCRSSSFESAGFDCPKLWDGVEEFQKKSNFTLPFQDMTVEAWVRFNSDPERMSGKQPIISCHQSDPKSLNVASRFEFGWSLGLTRNAFSFGLSSPSPGLASSNPNGYKMVHEATSGPLFWRKSRWYHLAGTYDGNYRKLYIDGQLWASFRQQGPIQYPDCEFAIGAVNACEQPMFSPEDGSYDVSEIRLWNVARSSADIQTYKDVRISTLNATNDGLLGVWRRVSVDASTNVSVIKDETGLQPDAVVPYGSAVVPLSPEAAAASQLFPPSQTEPRWNEDTQGNCISEDSVRQDYPEMLKLCESWIVDRQFVDSTDATSWETRRTIENSLATMTFVVGFLSSKCQESMLSLLCSRYFPACITPSQGSVKFQPKNDSGQVLLNQPFHGAFPAPSCRGACEEVRVTCKEDFQTVIPGSNLVFAARIRVGLFSSCVICPASPSCSSSFKRKETLRLVCQDDFNAFLYGSVDGCDQANFFPNSSLSSLGPFQYDSELDRRIGCGASSTAFEATECPDGLVRTVATAAASVGLEIPEAKDITTENVPKLVGAIFETGLSTATCIPQCPVPVTGSQASLKALHAILAAFSWVSLALCSLSCAALASLKKNRKVPGVLLPLMLLFLCLLSFALTLGSWIPSKGGFGAGDGDSGDASMGAAWIDSWGAWGQWTCPTSASRVSGERQEEVPFTIQGESSLCDFQGSLLQFCFVTVVGYWVTTLHFLSRVMGGGNNKSGTVSDWKYLCFAPGVALLLLIVVVSTSSLGASSLGTYCWIRRDRLAIIGVCFYTPLLLASGFSFRFLCKYRSHVKKMETSKLRSSGNVGSRGNLTSRMNKMGFDKVFRKMFNTTLILLVASCLILICAIHVYDHYPGFFLALEVRQVCSYAVAIFNLLSSRGDRERYKLLLIELERQFFLEIESPTGYADKEGSCDVGFKPGFSEVLVFLDHMIFGLLGGLIAFALTKDQVKLVASARFSAIRRRFSKRLSTDETTNSANTEMTSVAEVEFSVAK